MRILQLCFFTNLWPKQHEVVNIDLRLGLNVLDLNDNFGKDFDIIFSAPPCDQFTKASAHCWVDYPDNFVQVAKKCFDICINSGKPWVYENPPGRIETFIPALKKYRIMTWRSKETKKEYVLYSNHLILYSPVKRYSAKPLKKFDNMTKRQREAWQKDLVSDLAVSFSL
jgi:hypothetical protein